jgi:glycosyltransferase involved in cell wall biosynthesis
MAFCTAAVVSLRLGGRDGVSIEAAKWANALTDVGVRVTTVAGEGTADHIVAGLGLVAGEPPDAAELDAALAGADLVVVENACSLPLNPGATAALARALRGRPAVLRHHDLPWQRQRYAGVTGVPPDDPAWRHVTINELSRHQLARRGIDATTIANFFDVDEPAGRRAAARAAIGVDGDAVVVVQPTRAIARKNVPAGLALAEALGAIYWLLGPTEEDYDALLQTVLGGAAVPVVFGRPDGVSMADVYAASDAVVLPSSWEGFGNATVESAVHRRPLAISRYPVAREIAAYGFRWFPADDTEPLRAWLAHPDVALLDANHAIARRHFSLERLRRRLEALLEEAAWAA